MPYIIYADFESYFETSNKNDTSKTTYIKKHKPMGFGYKIVQRQRREISTTNESNVLMGNKHDVDLSSDVKMYLGEVI